MPESKEFREKLKSYSNKELIRILRYRRDYTSHTIGVIQRLLEERVIEQEELDKILDQLNEEEQLKQELEQDSLNYWEKLLLVCVPILGFVLYLVFRWRNKELKYSKKMGRSLSYSLLGTIIFAILLIVILYK